MCVQSGITVEVIVRPFCGDIPFSSRDKPVGLAVLRWRENRLSLYGLSEQKIEGDGNCQVILPTFHIIGTSIGEIILAKCGRGLSLLEL